jgi:hypothetical protein
LAAALAAGLSTGCGGFNATPSWSPLSLFLPGIAKTEPKEATPPDSPLIAQSTNPSPSETR